MESQELKDPKGNQAFPVYSVLVSKGLPVSQDCQDWMVKKDSQENKGQLGKKEARDPQGILVFLGFRGFQVLRVMLDRKERKVRNQNQKEKLELQGILESEDLLEERAWMESLEFQEQKEFED